jgi:hypothetical protein
LRRLPFRMALIYPCHSISFSITSMWLTLAGCGGNDRLTLAVAHRICVIMRVPTGHPALVCPWSMGFFVRHG